MNISEKRLNELDSVLGFDCSKWQKDINWLKASQSGIKFAFIKISEGDGGTENYDIKDRVLEAQKNTIKIGYYHFARPSSVSNPELDSKL